MSVTIKDVAKLAGVSPSTVSRVISKHPRISKETINRVQKIMDELGYHPNIMAKSLVSKTTHTLGMLLPQPAEELFLNLFFPEVMRGIVTQASHAGYDMLITSGCSEREELENVIRLVKGCRIDGLILVSSRKNDPLISFLRKENFPFVLIGRTEDFPDVLSVDNDNVQLGYDATKHLISQGHFKIGFMNGPSNLIVCKDRFSGYVKAINETKLPLHQEWIAESDFSPTNAAQIVKQMMQGSEKPTAIVTFDDVIGFGALNGLREMNLKAPDDVSIVSFNNVALSQISSPTLTSYDIGIYQLGYTASKVLIQAIKGEKLDQTTFIIPHKLIERQSSVFEFSLS